MGGGGIIGRLLINSLMHTVRTRLDAQKSRDIEAYLLLDDNFTRG